MLMDGCGFELRCEPAPRGLDGLAGEIVHVAGHNFDVVPANAGTHNHRLS